MTRFQPEHRVDVVEEKGSARNDRIRCAIGEHLSFDTEGIETYCVARWNATAYDACVIGAAVQFCDHTKRRSATDWGRDIALRVPVHDPDLWRSANVSGALHDALSFLTGDQWRIDFARRKKDFAPPRQQPFDFPSSCVVMPFSDGLDSHLAAGLLQRKYGDALVRVRLGSKSSPGGQPQPRRRERSRGCRGEYPTASRARSKRVRVHAGSDSHCSAAPPRFFATAEGSFCRRAAKVPSDRRSCP